MPRAKKSAAKKKAPTKDKAIAKKKSPVKDKAAAVKKAPAPPKNAYRAVSPDHWERFPPPVDTGLWRRFMDEPDSDSAISDIDSEAEKPMAPKITPPDKKAKDDAGKADVEKTNAEKASAKKTDAGRAEKDEIREVLTDSFNAAIYKILDGQPLDEVIDVFRREEASKKAKTSTTAQPASKPPSTNPALAALPICPSCSLPRLQYPRIGLNSRPVPDPTASYCANEPPIVLAGHDVHGNAFPGFKPKLNAQNNLPAQVAAPNTTTTAAPPSPSSTASSTNPAAPSSSAPAPSSSSTTTTTAGSVAEYPSIRTPQLHCPNNCGQWKAAGTMAKHLEACMLGKGRKAGREARERIGKEAEGSRAVTPVTGSGSGSGSKRRADDEAGDGIKPGVKKVKKTR